MTTDITELAQREKFEAWWERTQHNGNPPRFGWSHWRDGEGYKVDDDDSELEGMWEAWKAAGAEMAEALEKAQKSNAFLKGQLSELANFNPDWDKLEASYESWREIAAELLVAKERIAELESRTVTVKPMRPGHITVGGEKLGIYMRDEVDEFLAALTTAGIKVEAE